MAVSIDTSVVGNGNGVNSVAFASLTTTGHNELLIAAFHVSNTTPSGVTFDGPFTWSRIGTFITIPNAGGRMFLYWARSQQPIAGQTLTATFTGGGFPQSSQILLACGGTRISEPLGAISNNTATSTSVSSSVTTTRANSLVIAFAGQTGNQGMAPGTSQSEANETASVGGVSTLNATYQDSATASSGTSVTMDTSIAISDDMGMYAIELLVDSPSKPLFRPNQLRPRAFAPGIAR